ncbi:MAG: biotin transporter BioY [Candidatus Thermochlorobacter sp.]
MQTTLSLSSPSLAKDAAIVIAFAALTALSAQFEIPLYPVPITMQTAAVLAAGVFAGAKLGTTSQVLYLIAGLFLPIYSGGAMGAAHLFGPTGGYLISFPIAAYLTGVLVGREHNVVQAFIRIILASLVIFAIGAAWLKVALQLSVEAALAQGVYPFLIGDVLKCALVAASFWAWRALKNQART